MKRFLLHEKTLLTRVAGGDEKAFELIFHHYRHKIYHYAFHLFEDRDKADELVQDVFLKVWLSRDKILEVESFDAWLFIIARNKTFDALKRISLESSRKAAIAGSFVQDPETAEIKLINKENEQILHHALGRLSPQQKLIFTLSRHQGMKHAEIADRLNISRHTVKTHLVHALKVLRHILPLGSDTLLVCCVVLQYFLPG